ncbi:hypothetical protein [Klebsiella pneumoniae]
MDEALQTAFRTDGPGAGRRRRRQRGTGDPAADQAGAGQRL